MKKISVVINGLQFSKTTLEYAIQIARNGDALLTGIFIEDFTYHSHQLYELMESPVVTKEKVNQLMKKDKKLRQEAAEAFEQACINANIRYTSHHDEGIAIQELLKETIYTDLLIIGASETFSNYSEEKPSLIIKELLADSQCPIMIIPSHYKKIEKVFLLYDGKPSSVFAIKMFNYTMPWMREISAQVITVLESEAGLEAPDNKQIKEFIKCHYPDAEYTLLYGKPETDIVSYFKEINQEGLIVLGAYRRSTISMWFKRSMADILLREISLPLFIAHNK